MADFTPEAILNDDCCCPCEPIPTPQNEEPCTGTLSGAITGTVTMERCCCMLKSRSFVFDIGPRTIPQLIAFKQSTFTAWENANFIVLGSSLIDSGSGWVLSLHVGWQV